MKTNELLENAKSLRKAMTKQEKHLWYDFLCKYPVKRMTLPAGNACHLP